MTLNELYSIPHLEREIDEISKRIKEIEEMGESTTAQLSGMPSSNKKSDKVGECGTALAYYKELLYDAQKKRIVAEIEIVKYIETVKDAEMRRKLWLRFVRQMQWQEIADKIGGNNTEDSIRKSVNRFVNKNCDLSDMSVAE